MTVLPQFCVHAYLTCHQQWRSPVDNGLSDCLRCWAKIHALINSSISETIVLQAKLHRYAKLAIPAPNCSNFRIALNDDKRNNGVF